ncbi:hypothetical protein K788_0006723 [Paraburkholderia caribensis MBA4]|uniref:Uncharacterized protein n=1 Tax=Paraburkholderia caribensis MBA4 TaxID=1323664 RepID=A0A0P0R542_9BURK|nr:hypothetical protein K788_0006723 [Paraburkholderia caribensis MBA4]
MNAALIIMRRVSRAPSCLFVCAFFILPDSVQRLAARRAPLQ